jgi:hypothetical protein
VTMKIKLADLLKPPSELAEILVVFLELCERELVRRALLRDLGLEALALLQKLVVGLVAICVEARQDLFLLRTIQCRSFEEHGLARHLSDLVFEHLEPPQMVVGPRQHADAVLKVDPTHGLDPPPQGDALPRGFRGNFVGQHQPRVRVHAASCCNDRYILSVRR